MERYPDYTRTRLRQLADRMRTKIYPESVKVTSLVVSGPTDRISYAEAQSLTDFRNAELGEQFGPLWSTFWFKVRADVPAHWAGQRVDLIWESHSEATLWVNGRSIQGLNHNPKSWDGSTRPDAVLLPSAKGGETLDMQVEMACNKLFGDEGNYGDYKHISPYVLDRVDIAVFDPEAWDLYYDFSFLAQLEADGHAGKENPLDFAWAGRLLSELNRFANTYDIDDRSTWAESKEILKGLYSQTNGSFTHENWAIGHAHIDTAWLWPIAETHRKCERTFSTATAYMDEYPEYKFACSQAYQYQVIKERNPDLYARIQAKAKTGQWVPVGGTWVEPDCNIPSGEALVRQFLTGQRFFKQEFGAYCNEFWNPDVFGYNGQLPQILQISGVTRFLTQKLSWNRFNKPHHHTFMWQGIDGSEVLTHFPPADTYNAVCTPEQLRWNLKNFKDSDRSNMSLILFGFGDGGGGPTKWMLEYLKRSKDIQGVPRAKLGTVNEFFDKLEENYQDRTKLVGELYFEYHRGTYTTQAATKKGNRKSEIALHDAEFISVLASSTAGKAYPAAKLDELWKLVLLNQFHDILPGSSITLVYDDAALHYAKILGEAGEVITGATAALGSPDAEGSITPLNTLSFDRAEVVTKPNGELAYAVAPSYGFGELVAATDSVSVTETTEGFVLANGQLKATISRSGLVTSLIDLATGREAFTAPANQFYTYDDKPTSYDAWDVDPFHLETEKPIDGATAAAITETSALRSTVAFEYKVGKASSLKQKVSLSAGAKRLEFSNVVEWQEDQTMLKVGFPVNVRAMNATYEMQFGTVERPTHFNTTYDLARYEVPGHKWVDLSEHGYGVAILSESKYGYSTFDNVIRMSLLRATTHPDPKADRGTQEFSYAVYPHAGGWQDGGVVAEGFKFNVPVQFVPGSVSPKSFFSVDTDALVLDTVKKAEDDDSLVLRFYESEGGRGTANVSVALPFKSAVFTNALEDGSEPVQVVDGKLVVPFQPYKIITVKLIR